MLRVRWNLCQGDNKANSDDLKQVWMFTRNKINHITFRRLRIMHEMNNNRRCLQELNLLYSKWLAFQTKIVNSLNIYTNSCYPVGVQLMHFVLQIQGVPKKRGIKNFNFLTQYLELQTVLRNVFVLKIKLWAYTLWISSFATPKPHLKLNLGGFISHLYHPHHWYNRSCWLPLFQTKPK